MATPSAKSEGMVQFLNTLAREVYGRDRVESIRDNVCVDCGEPSTYFRDGKSETEYTISGVCQVCQDRDMAFFKSLEAESND